MKKKELSLLSKYQIIKQAFPFLMISNLQIIEQMRLFLQQAKDNPSKYCERAQDFSRNRLLSFERVVYFILNLSKRSLAIELNDFFNSIYPLEQVPTKGAFSQARYKLKADLFKDWNKSLVEKLNDTHFVSNQTYNGLFLIGIDGTTLQLPDTTSIEEEFGTLSNNPMAQVVCAYDVINGICLASKIAPIRTSEPKLAIELLEELPKESLSIYDRCFASSGLIYLLNRAGNHFLIRAKVDFNNQIKAFVRSKKYDKVVEFPFTDNTKKLLKGLGISYTLKQTVKVRLVKVILDTGEIEVLITSLFDKNAYPVTLFKELYFRRWGVEVYYDLFKNILQSEIFTGHKSVAIYQEFYAMILLSNIHQLLVNQTQNALNQANKTRKHKHKINQNISIGLMKYQVIKMLILNDSDLIAYNLIDKFLKHTVAVIPNRKVERKKHPVRLRGKYRTFTNYRRAA